MRIAFCRGVEDTLPFIDVFQVTTVKPQKFNFSQLRVHAETFLCKYSENQLKSTKEVLDRRNRVKQMINLHSLK